MTQSKTLAAEVDAIMRKFPADMQMPMREFAVWMLDELHISYKDFSELKDTVQRMATVQEHTDHQLAELSAQVRNLTEAQEKLATAQERTEQKVEKLAEAQEKLTTAQERTEQKVEKLAEAQEKLATAQERTEQKVEKLAEAQERTEYGLQRLEKSLSDQISALGSRWGIYNEGVFRSTMYGVLQELDGVTVHEGFYGGRQVDVVIRNGEHILLEITSRMHAKDIDKLYQSAEDYEAQEGVRPKLMVATSYISPKLMQKIMGLERPIDIFSFEAE